MKTFSPRMQEACSHPAGVDTVHVGQVEIAGTRGISKLGFKSRSDGAEDFALVLPPSRPFPDILAGKAPIWVVVLHGHGSTGDQLFTRTDIRELWLPKIVEGGFGILAPNIRGNSWMCEGAVDDLHSLLKHVREQYGVQGFIFLGGSMGGTSALIYSSLHPSDVMACVALCPATDLRSFRDFAGNSTAPVIQEIAAAIDNSYGKEPANMEAHSALSRRSAFTMPLFVGHAVSDPIIPVEQSRRFANAAKGGAIFKYVEMPGGHDSPLSLMPEGLDWVSSILAE